MWPSRQASARAVTLSCPNRIGGTKLRFQRVCIPHPRCRRIPEPDDPHDHQGFAPDGGGLAGSTTATAWPSASEAALALTTASLPSRPETTSASVPSLRPSAIGRRTALPPATTTQNVLSFSVTMAVAGTVEHVGVLLGDDRRVGIEAGRSFPPGLGMSISTRIVRVFGIERPGDPRDLPLDGLALHRLELDRGAIARVDLGGERLGDVDGDRHDVGPGDDEQRLGVGAGPGQVAGVDVPLRDDAVEGGLDLGVAEHGLDAAGVRLGDLDGGGGGGDVGTGLVQRGAALDQADLGRLDLGVDFLAGRLGRAELVPGLVEQAAGLRPCR